MKLTLIRRAICNISDWLMVMRSWFCHVARELENRDETRWVTRDIRSSFDPKIKQNGLVWNTN